MAPDGEISAIIDTIARQDRGRLLAALISNLRDFQLAEDCLADAFASALDHWPRGIPDNPQGWLLQTARRRAIDRLRREQNFQQKVPDIAQLIELDARDNEDARAQEIPDERLRLIFTACHPALDQKTRIALTLRTLCGVTTDQIARAFLDSEDAMAQRLVRARHKIAKAGIPYKVPEAPEWRARLNSVLTVIYLIFNEGRDLGSEAHRLAHLVNALHPDDPEVLGLIALMELNDARAPARYDASGAFIPLEAQDRTQWDQALKAKGLRRIEGALRLGRAGPFQLQAAISAIHCEADSFAQTGWHEIVLIYDRLIEMIDTPVIRLNRAVALSYVAGAAPTLKELKALEPDLKNYQSYQAALADMSLRAGDARAALKAYAHAIKLTQNEAQKTFLIRKSDQAKKEAEQSSAQVQQGG